MEFLKFSKKNPRKSIDHNRYSRLRLINGVIFGLLIFFATLFYLRSNTFLVRRLSITENFQDIGLYNLSIKPHVEQKLIEYVNDSIFSVNPSEIRESILASFVEIADADVKKELPDALVFTYTIRSPSMRIKSAENYYLTDRTGLVFSANVPESAKGLPELILGSDTAVNGEGNIVGQKLDEAKIRNASTLASYDWKTIGKVETVTVYSYYYQLKFAETEILMRLNDIEQQISNIFSIQKDALSKGKIVSQFDLRFEKAVVRYK